LVLTVVNPDVAKASESEIAIRGGGVKSGSVTTLTHTDIHAHNTFEQRNAVKPEASSLNANGKVIRYAFPPASVTKLELVLE
jgi:alpha-L-arabinofuranosidase